MSACSLSIKNSTHEIGVVKENFTKDTNSKMASFSLFGNEEVSIFEIVICPYNIGLHII